jgi:beta-glucosidase
MPTLSFPPGFVWGTATSAYQIEGATEADGRGESIWDRFCRTPGKVQDGATGDVACDHYHRWPQDIELLKKLKLAAYRFSIAWPRILPQGSGLVNQAGLDHYERFVDALLDADIEPYVTLYHWDLPQALEEAGGWAERLSAEAFVEYADAVSRRLGDRVENWITHNEPWCASMLGYQTGHHAPGRRDRPAALRASHHLLLSHGMAVPVIRSNTHNAEVGITLNLVPAVAASDSAEDHDACRHFDGYFNRWFLDPLFGRHYPADMVNDYVQAGHLPANGLHFVQPGDLETISGAIDFLGINYYNREVVRSGKITEADNRPRKVFVAPKDQHTEMGWEVHPDGLREILTRVYQTYRPAKIYVTENGASYSTAPDASGRVRDARRITYLRDHFIAAHQAIEAGVPLAGYFVWSFLDNFEWAFAYAQRFGITWIDYQTQQRIPKDSALWYRGVIENNAVDSETLRATG